VSFGRYPYGGVGYAGSDVDEISSDDLVPTLAVEVAFTTGALEEPAWVDVTGDVRSWDTMRGRNRELERFQPGRATIVLGNLSRQYDSVNTAGPWYGYLKPMKRVRIRETFNGVTHPVFDGFVDRWQLDYPMTGIDATATVTATDAFKIFARTDMPKSVYRMEVEADAPTFWWMLDEGLEEGIGNSTALNSGSVGALGNGTYVGAVNPGAPRIVVNDPGTSLEQANSSVTPGVPVSGVDYPSSQLNFFEKFNTPDPFTIELWCRPQEDQTFGLLLFNQATTPGSSQFYVYWFTGVGNTGRFSLTAGAESVNTPVNSAPPGSIYHVVVTFTPNGANQDVSIYVDGVLSAGPSTLTGTLNTGTITTAAIGRSTSTTGFNWTGRIAQVAVYNTSLSAARIADHYAAGTAPWAGDTAGERIGRVLDIPGWPASLRLLDAGNESFQSATLSSTVLEHLQKAAETEFGSLFVDRAGNVRFQDRETLFGRTPDDVVFGDGAGEIGYRSFVPDDGDQVLRNRATISRLGGRAQLSVDAVSVEEFGRFDYLLDGLLHSSDSYSQDYANLLAAEYAEPRRRITSLSLGPAAPGVEADLYPQMLARELGDPIVVSHTPPGGGDPFSQTCVIEGVEQSGAPGPGGRRLCRWLLSPEFSVRALEAEEVATLGYAQVTANQTAMATGTEVDATGLAVTVTVSANRYIRISTNLMLQRSVADNVTVAYIKEGATYLQVMGLRQTTAAIDETLSGSIVIDSPSAGSHTYKIATDRSGTGTRQITANATRPAFILVEDIGPS
jgi:hypothetical protein